MKKERVDLVVVLRRKEMEMVVVLLVMEEGKLGRSWGVLAGDVAGAPAEVAGWVGWALLEEEKKKKKEIRIREEKRKKRKRNRKRKRSDDGDVMGR